MKFQLFERSKDNPIITSEDFPDNWRVNAVLNPGVADRDGLIILFVRVEGLRGISKLVCFSSKDGITEWQIDESTIFTGAKGEIGYGVEDPRLTWIDSLQKWAIVYTNHSTDGPLVSIATTTDFRKFKYLGNVLPPPNKDAALFPEPLNGYWWLIHRPSAKTNQIWIARTKDTKSGDDNFRYWGEHKILLPTLGGPGWDEEHIGLNTPPLKTEHGWLLLYHGVIRTGSGVLYRLGLAMLALDDPTKVTHRSREFIMSPEQTTDLIGDVGGAIFPCGWRVDDEKYINIYYGAADKVICHAQAPLQKVLNSVLQNPV